MGGQRGGGKGSDEAQTSAGRLNLKTGSNQGEAQRGATPICGVPAEEGPGRLWAEPRERRLLLGSTDGNKLLEIKAGKRRGNCWVGLCKQASE